MKFSLKMTALAVAASLLMAVGVQSASAADDSVTISGRITTSTGTPISGARVTLNELREQPYYDNFKVTETTSASDGTYSFTGAPAGTLSIEVGYSCPMLPPVGSSEPAEPCYFNRGWAERPDWSYGDHFETTVGQVLENMDVPLYEGASINGDFTCSFCDELFLSKGAGLERRDPISGAWDGVRGSYNNYTSFAFYQLLPGEYRVKVGVGTGMGRAISQIFTLAEGQHIDLETLSVERDGILMANSTGTIAKYTISSKGKLSKATVLGKRFGPFVNVLDAGDLTGDGRFDLVARTKGGTLALLAGVAPGRWASSSLKTGFKSYKNLSIPGDITGDGNVDLLAQSSTGTLYVFAGTGQGGFATRQVLGQASAWKKFSIITGAGDFDSDGKPDLIAKTPAGAAYLFTNSETGLFDIRRKVSSSWSSVTQVLSMSALYMDGDPSLIVRKTGGDVVLVKGRGGNAFAGTIKLATGWNGRILI